MATLKDVAKRAGVSVATASRAIAGYGYVKDSTRERIFAAATALGYRPNALARSMVKRTTHTIGLLISDIANPFFADVARGVSDAANRRGYTVIVCNSDENESKEKHYIEVFLEKQVDGILVASSARGDQHLQSAEKQNVPVVLLDRNVRQPIFDAIEVDNVLGAYNAVNYLLSLGHKRTAIITGPAHIATAQARVRGYQNALANAGIALDRSLIHFGNFKESGGSDGVRRLLSLDNPPSALFTANNLTTTGAMNALRELNIRIPEQISLVGFDDLTWMRVIDPPLTVVQQPAYLMGSTAVDLLFQRLDGRVSSKRQIVQLKSQLVIRGSCAPFSS